MYVIFQIRSNYVIDVAFKTSPQKAETEVKDPRSSWQQFGTRVFHFKFPPINKQTPTEVEATGTMGAKKIKNKKKNMKLGAPLRLRITQRGHSHLPRRGYANSHSRENQKRSHDYRHGSTHFRLLSSIYLYTLILKK